MSTTITKFYSFEEACREKKHNLASDDLKWVLCLTAPVVTNTVLADITQIANGNGYTTGGTSMTVTSSGSSSGLYTLMASAVTFTASGGTMATFRYAVLYNNTATNDELIGFIDFSTGRSLATGEYVTITPDATSGLYYAS